jgi:hypothetical protein
MTITETQTSPPSYQFPSVQTIYVLASGKLIHSLCDFEQVKNLFTWLDKKVILTELLHARACTEIGKLSIVAVYEAGKRIKTFLNLENDFHWSDLQMKVAST